MSRADSTFHFPDPVGASSEFASSGLYSYTHDVGGGGKVELRQKADRALIALERAEAEAKAAKAESEVQRRTIDGPPLPPPHAHTYKECVHKRAHMCACPLLYSSQFLLFQSIVQGFNVA